MKIQDMTLIAVAALLSVMAIGCSGRKETKGQADGSETQPKNTNAAIQGQWFIENIVFNDSDYVRPDEAVPGARQYVVFDDSTYFIMTNCNSIAGSYTVKGDSIALGEGAMTEMACENMDTEDALRRILPRISTIEVQNDSVVRLNGSAPAECILLRKAKTEIK